MELATAIMMEEHRLVLDKGKTEDMPLRLVEQLGLELDHSGSGVELSHQSPLVRNLNLDVDSRL